MAEPKVTRRMTQGNGGRFVASRTHMPTSISLQTMAPIMSQRRRLAPDESQAVEAGESQWLPRIFQSYGTPLPELMSSPGKGALMGGIGGALAGGAAGGLAGRSPLAAVLGALAGGGLGAGGMYLKRKANNEGLREMMSRLPSHPTLRDLQADPVYNQEQLIHTRAEQTQALAALLGQRAALNQHSGL